VNFRVLWTRYPFPFKGALWVFWLLVIAPVVWGTTLPCAPHPEYFYLTYPVVAVVACLWEAHARQLLAGSSMGLAAMARMTGRTAANLLILLFFSLLLAVPVSIFTPTYQCYNERAKAAELVLATVGLRETIEGKVKTSKTLEKSGLDVSVQPAGRVSGGFVTDTGTIILISEDPPAVVTMTPVLKNPNNGDVHWQCRGYPEKVFPLMCRAEGQK
jgi:hypothetical protein